MLQFTNLKILKPVDTFAFLINLILLIISSGLIILHTKALPLQVPFWYSKQWGVDRLANSNALWLIPILILVVFILNNLLAKFLERNNPVVAKIIVWASSFATLIFAFSLYRIILVVI